MRVRDVLLPVGGAAWSVDKDFDVYRHVKRVRLPQGEVDQAGGGFMAGATRLAGELMEQPSNAGCRPGRCTSSAAPTTAPSPCS